MLGKFPIIFIATVLNFTVVTKACPTRCKIQVFDTQLPWSVAQPFCQRNGLQLASIENQEKYECALQRIKDAGLPDATNYWTGANDIEKEGEFVWATNGNPVTQFFLPNMGQPDDNGKNEDCVSLRKVFPGNNVNAQHIMNDERCILNFATLCE